MATPKNASYKKAQRAARRSKYSFTPIWVSMEYNIFAPGGKKVIQGTCRIRKDQQRLRGKAAIKASKRLTHTKGFYNVPVSI